MRCRRLAAKGVTEGVKKNADRFAPKDAAACVVPPYFAFPPRGNASLRCIGRALFPPKRPSARALSESPCSLWAILSDGGARLLLFFNGKHVCVLYYRRFLPACQRISRGRGLAQSSGGLPVIRSTSPAASAPVRSRCPPCAQSSSPKRRFGAGRPCSAGRAGRAAARSKSRNAAPD